MKFAVQLYSLRNEITDDVFKTLKQVKAMGYEGVEFAGFYGIKKEEMKKNLDEIGLIPVASHTSIEELENDFDNVTDYNKYIGNTCIVIPFMSLDDYADVISGINRINIIARKLKEKGFDLFYHNHAHEFTDYNGEWLLDKLVHAFKPSRLKNELDTYWVSRAGVNPIEYINKNAEYCKLIHLKDMPKSEDHSQYEAVGLGTLDIKGIIKASVCAGVEWFVVENDDPYPSGMDNILKSINFLKSM